MCYSKDYDGESKRDKPFREEKSQTASFSRGEPPKFTPESKGRITVGPSGNPTLKDLRVNSFETEKGWYHEGKAFVPGGQSFFIYYKGGVDVEG